MSDFPIVIVAPTKGEASIAATKLKLPYPEFHIVLIGNGSLQSIQGLRVDRYHTFFVDPARITYKIREAIESSWLMTDGIENARTRLSEDK